MIDFTYKGGVSKRIYLAPLDQAPAHLPRSEFGPCRMGRFSCEELADILNNAALDRFEHDELDIGSVNIDPLLPATPPPGVESLSWRLDYCPTSDGDPIEFELPLTRRMKNEAFDDFQAKLSQIWRALEQVCPLGHTRSSALNRLVEHFLLRRYLEKGIDELIMHMTAVDAAVGKQQKGMTKAIGKRLKQLLNDEDASQEFGRLYDLRSAYIHPATRCSRSLTEPCRDLQRTQGPARVDRDDR